MQRSNDPSTFDHATMEQLMARYRAELLSYQRATPPGRPTLAQSLREVTVARTPAPQPAKAAPAPEPVPEPVIAEPVVPGPELPGPVEPECALPPSDAVPVIPDPVPLAITGPDIVPKAVPAPSPAMIAGFAASVAADFTAGIFAAAASACEPEIVAEAVEAVEKAAGEGTETVEGPPCPAPGAKTVEEMRATLAESLADLSQARVAGKRCAACGSDPGEVIANAPTRYRSLLPDETVELPSCPCGDLPMLTGEFCDEIPAAPGEGPVVLPTPALPEEPCVDVPAAPGEGPVVLPTPALPEEPCVDVPAAPGKGPVVLPTPALPEEPCVDVPASPDEGPVALPTPVLPEEPCVEAPAAPPGADCTVLSIRPDAPGTSSSCLCCGHTEYEKCIGAYGTFRPYEKMDHLTRAAFLQKPGEAVQVLARFAADLPDGGADASRCRRSFSVKFFCKKGEYDLLGQHLPVTVGCEQQAVAACCSTTRADPATGLRSRSRFWEYVAQNPVALHAAIWLYSDLGTIGSYRAIDGFCSPAVWADSRGGRRLARCCWLSRQRPQTLTRFESEELCGYDPDAVARDFVTAISRGEYPQYELAVQLLEPGRELPFDPYDPTLVWPQEIAPPRRIGLMTLDRLPEQIRPDLDAGRFDAAHLIEGIEPALPALPAEGRELAQAGDHLRGQSERERRRLIDNLCDELMQLPADLLEKILILFSKADLGFGQALTAALGG